MAFGPKIAVRYDAKGRVVETKVLTPVSLEVAVTSLVDTWGKVTEPRPIPIILKPTEQPNESRALKIALDLAKSGFDKWVVIEKQIRMSYIGSDKTQNYIDKNCRKTKGFLIKRGYKIT